MNERFDDMIRRRLEGHESDVPNGLFDAINDRPEVQDALFDNVVRSKLALTKSTVPAGMFNALTATTELEHLGFDSAIRSKIEQHTSAVPANIWQRIVAEKERRRRPIAWWWVAAAVLLLVGTGTFFLVKLTTELPDPAMVTERKEAGKPDIHSTEQPGKENRINNNGMYSKPVEQSAIPIQSDPTPLPNPNHNTTRSVNQNEVSTSHSQFSTDQQVVDNKKNLLKKTFSKQPETTADRMTATSNALQLGSAVQATNENSLVTTQLSILGTLRNMARLSPDQLLKAKPHAPVIPCPTNGDEKHSAWYVEAYGSAFLLQKNITDKGTGKNAKAGFDTTLHRQVSFNAGITLVKNMGKNFLLKTGLQYNRINENFRLTQINERRLITTISVRTVIISPGDTVRIRDTSTVEQIGTAQHRHQNRYDQWDIPVLVGYELSGENIQLNVNAGIIANIRSSYEGEMLTDSTRQIFDINHYNSKPLYRKTVGFSLYAGWSIVKPLSDKMSLLIEPHARIGLGNTANSQVWFSQKNNTLGLSLGLRYKLGGNGQRMY